MIYKILLIYLVGVVVATIKFVLDVKKRNTHVAYWIIVCRLFTRKEHFRYTLTSWLGLILN